MQQLAPHLGEAIRTGLLRTAALDPQAAGSAPGVVMLAPDLTVVGMTPAGGRWLEELPPATAGLPAPAALCAVALRLRALQAVSPPAAALPRVRVRTRTGRWVVLHASWMSLEGSDQIAVVIEQARPLEVAPLLMAAYGLTLRNARSPGWWHAERPRARSPGACSSPRPPFRTT